jgi:hypothetical protein
MRLKRQFPPLGAVVQERGQACQPLDAFLALDANYRLGEVIGKPEPGQSAIPSPSLNALPAWRYACARCVRDSAYCSS